MAKLYDLRVVKVTFTSIDLPDGDVFKKYFRNLVLWTESTRSGFKHCAQFESLRRLKLHVIIKIEHGKVINMKVLSKKQLLSILN